MDLQHISSGPRKVLERAATYLPFSSLVMETLSTLIKEANYWGELKGIKNSNLVFITNLLFVDGIMIFKHDV